MSNYYDIYELRCPACGAIGATVENEIYNGELTVFAVCLECDDEREVDTQTEIMSVRPDKVVCGGCGQTYWKIANCPECGE